MRIADLRCGIGRHILPPLDMGHAALAIDQGPAITERLERASPAVNRHRLWPIVGRFEEAKWRATDLKVSLFALPF